MNERLTEEPIIYSLGFVEKLEPFTGDGCPTPRQIVCSIVYPNHTNAILGEAGITSIGAVRSHMEKCDPCVMVARELVKFY